MIISTLSFGGSPVAVNDPWYAPNFRFSHASVTTIVLSNGIPRCSFQLTVISSGLQKFLLDSMAWPRLNNKAAKEFLDSILTQTWVQEQLLVTHTLSTVSPRFVSAALSACFPSWSWLMSITCFLVIMSFTHGSMLRKSLPRIKGAESIDQKQKCDLLWTGSSQEVENLGLLKR